jgi:ABC-type transport system involved in multi-copper enzyme maturation permease subunit
LLVTPLGKREILYSKWLGNILIVRWPLGFLAIAYGLAVLAGGIHWLAWPLLVTSWFVYAGFLASLGLFLSTVCSSTLRATLLTVLITLGLGFSPATDPTYTNSSAASQLLKNIQRYGMSPPRTMAMLAFNGRESEDTYGEIQAALIGVLIYAGAGILLWEFSVARFDRSKGHFPRRGWSIGLFRPRICAAVPAPQAGRLNGS